MQIAQGAGSWRNQNIESWGRANQILQVLTREFLINLFFFQALTPCFINGLTSKQTTKLPNVIKTNINIQISHGVLQVLI